jgi:ADP-ribosyl-[dinitrogen reductase] hydrolase
MTPENEHLERASRIRGLFYGLALGDSIGGPTHMAILLAESLLLCGDFVASDVQASYLHWHQNGGFDTGPVAARVFNRWDRGMSMDEAALEVHHLLQQQTAGCNPAHRCVGFAAAHFLQNDALTNAVLAEAKLTHYDPLAGDVACAVVLLCRALIDGTPWEESCNIASSGRLPETQRSFENHALDQLSNGGYAPDVLAAALYFVRNHTTFAPFSSALRASFLFAGGGNYCPVLVGAIAGARWGDAEIPLENTPHKNLRTRLKTVAEEMAEIYRVF